MKRTHKLSPPPPVILSIPFWTRLMLILALLVLKSFSNPAFAQTSLFQISNLTPNNLNASQFAKYQISANSEVTAALWIIQMGDFAQQAADQYLEIKVPGNDTVRSFRAKYVWAEPNGKMDWYGEMQPSAGSHWGSGYASFSQLNGEILGYFTIEAEDYALRALGGGLYVLVKMDDGDTESACGFTVADIDLETAAQETQVAQDRECNVVVRVLILHTTQAAFANSQINEQTRQMLIAQANQALLNSHVYNNELVFVSAGGGLLSGFTESGNINFDLNLLRTDPAAIRLRNSLSVNADLVVLLTDGNYSGSDGTYYGLAPSCGPSDPASFCIVEVEQSISRMTFAHELAHLFGCKHSPNKGNGSCEPDFERPHWFECGGRDRYTIMESGVKRKDRIPHFSNPEVNYHGHPTGTHTTSYQGAVERDNARQLREQACLVASFRSSNDFKVHIDGDNEICEYETDSPYGYFANATGGAPGAYAYFWEISSNGTIYSTPPNNTGAWLELDYSNLQGGDKMFIRLRVTDAGGAVKYAFMTVEILANEHYVCSERSERPQGLAAKGSLFSLMPNPADGNTIAKIKGTENTPVSIEVVNSRGVSLQKISGLLASQEIPIEARSLPAGIYWVKATSKGIADVQKLVIVH